MIPTGLLAAPWSHFVANIGGGVWSVVKTLSQHQRTRWRRYVVGVYKGDLSPSAARDAEQLFDGAALLSRPSWPGSYHLMPPHVGATLRQLGVDPNADGNVYHFHTGPYTPLVYRLPRRPLQGRWLASFHGAKGNFGDTHSGLKRALHRRCVGRMLRSGIQLTAVSQRAAEDCGEMYGCRVDDFRVVYNGVGRLEDPSPAARQKPGRPFHIGFLGSVIPIKGWRKVVQAAERLRADACDVVCTIAGDGAEFADLRQLAAQREWLRAPGHVSQPRQSLLPELDALVLPSEFEGHSVALLEAIAAGVPCLCSDVGGNAETVGHDREGFVLQDASADEIACRVAQWIETPTLWAAMSANCVRRHREMFTADHMAAAWERLYEPATCSAVSPT